MHEVQLRLNVILILSFFEPLLLPLQIEGERTTIIPRIGITKTTRIFFQMGGNMSMHDY
jgi:hypothetical protein